MAARPTTYWCFFNKRPCVSRPKCRARPRDLVSNRAGGLHSARVRQPTLGRTREQARPPRHLPLRSAPHSPGLALASALASTTQGATSVTPSEPAHSVPAPPPSGAKHPRKRHALRGPCALFSRPTSRHPVTHGALPLHRPPRRPNSPSARPLIGAGARHPAAPLTTTTYGTPEPGYLTLSFASDARLAVLPESSHHLLHGLPRRHSIRI
jgi:hypothetical protein